MRQYRIYYKPPDKPWVALEPFVHSTIYDHPEVRDAIETIRQKPHVEGVVVRAEGKLFNVIAFTQPALAPQAFVLEPGSLAIAALKAIQDDEKREAA